MRVLRTLAAYAVMGFSGCATVDGYFEKREQARVAKEEEARQEEYRRQQYYAQQAAYDRMCLEPQTLYQQNWCIERQRQKDRAYAEERQRAEWAHQEQMQRQRMQFESRPVECTTRRSFFGKTRTVCE